METLIIAQQTFVRPRVACDRGHSVDLLTCDQCNGVEVPGWRVLRTPAFHWLGAVGVGPSLRELFMDFFMALSDRAGARAIGRRAQQWYREHYSRTVYTTKMVKLLSLVT